MLLSDPGGSQPRPILGQCLWAVAVAGLAALSWFKGVNFDETLALRSGWLALTQFDATPVLWSPWTLALGIIAHAMRDPAVTMHLGRALALTWVLLGVRANVRDPLCAALALFIACNFDPVIAHLVEFRYDASLIGAALFYQARLRDADRPLSWDAGLLLGFLMTHQLKGLVLGGLLLLMTLVARPRLPELSRVLIGASTFCGVWLGASLVSGQGERLRDGYLLFFRLRSVVPVASIDVSASLLAFAILALVAVALSLWKGPSQAFLPMLQRQLGLHAVGLAFVGLALLHPHALPYHLTPIALCLSLSIALDLSRLFPSQVPLMIGFLVLVGIASPWLQSGGSFATIQRVIASPLQATIATQRAVRNAERPGDRVFDPSGVLYFLPPCGRAWYADFLFGEWAKAGRWMAAPVEPPCAWALQTRRLRHMPPGHLAQVGEFHLQPATGGVLLHDDAGRHVAPMGLPDLTRSVW